MNGKNNHKRSSQAVHAAMEAVSQSEYIYGLEVAASIIGVSREQVANLIETGNLKDYGNGGHYQRRKFLRSDCEGLAKNRAKAGRKFGYRKAKENKI